MEENHGFRIYTLARANKTKRTRKFRDQPLANSRISAALGRSNGLATPLITEKIRKQFSVIGVVSPRGVPSVYSRGPLAYDEALLVIPATVDNFVMSIVVRKTGDVGDVPVQDEKGTEQALENERKIRGRRIVRRPIKKPLSVTRVEVIDRGDEFAHERHIGTPELLICNPLVAVKQ